MSRLIAVLSLFLVASFAAAQDGEPLVKRVKHSIAKGVAFLVSPQQQRDDGAWEHTEDQYKGGSTALAVLALLNCDGVIDDPALEQKRLQSIKRGIEQVRAIKSEMVYVRALQTMALAEARDPAHRKIIEANVQWLLAARIVRDGKFEGWYYTPRAAGTETDASNSQYAMLALWYARQAGVPIPRDVWQGIHDYYRRTQNDDGSWIYSTAYGPPDKAKASATMTVAGLCGLLIAGMELNGGREQWLAKGKVTNCGRYGDDAAVGKALRWTIEHFTVELEGRTYYHLYGLERAGRLSGLRFFGEHDWYREGCDAITKRRMPDGSWKAQGASYDRWPTVNTSFALLFLSKGRTPVIMSKLVHGKWGTLGRDELDTDWNNDRNDLRHLTEHVAKTPLFGKKPLAWQTYDIMRALNARLDDKAATNIDEAAVVADMLQSPILYITGHNSPLGRFQGGENKLIKRYTENGGFIFAEACCGDPAFDKGIKDWVKEVWDGAELQYLESTHSIWTRVETVPPGEPYKLMGLQVGCRTVMIYSPQDVSCHWEANRPDGDIRSKLAFRLGTNLIAYFTQGEAPLPRLTPIAVASDKALRAEKRGAFQIGQIYHAGDWQPAPKAMTNVLTHVQDQFGMEVMPKTERIFLHETRGVIASKFLYMHGKKGFAVAPDHRAALQFTLENGGLLLADACCGSAPFDKAFRQFVAELFPKEKLQRIPIGPERDVLFGAALNGKEALSAANIKCRTKANGKMEAMEPFLEGIRVNGRWVVIYSKYDIGCALERHTSSECVGYDHASALRIATAAVRYNARP